MNETTYIVLSMYRALLPSRLTRSNNTALRLIDETIPLLPGQVMPSNLLNLFHRRLRASEPLPSLDKIIHCSTTPDRHIHHNSIIHRLGRGVGPFGREHGQHDPERQKDNRGPGDGETEPVPGVEGPRRELVAAPDGAGEDRDQPGQVVAGHGEGEERGGGGRGDQGEEP